MQCGKGNWTWRSGGSAPIKGDARVETANRWHSFSSQCVDVEEKMQTATHSLDTLT